MRIAHILWSLGTGGTENMVIDIASIQAQEHKVAIFVLNDWVEKYMLEKLNKKCELHLIRRKKGSKNPFALLKFNYLLFCFQPDIIHHHAGKTVYCQKVCKNVPKIRTIHGLDNNPDEYHIFTKLYAISEAVKLKTNKQGFDCKTIWNGIKTELVIPKTLQSYNDGRLHFVQVARLFNYIKGQDLVLDAISILKQRGKNNICVHFIGEGESHKDLEIQANRLGIDDMVIFEGQMNQQYIYANLAKYDMFILASRREGFGLTIAEAMVAKIPVLVCDLEATMEVIGNGKYGRFFKREDPNDLAEKMFDFIEKGKDERQIEHAYQYALENFSVNITSKKYLNEYKGIIGK